MVYNIKCIEREEVIFMSSQIGDNIRRLRTEKGYTQKDVADKLFVTAQAVSRWENGEVEPSISTVGQIAQLYGVSSDFILGMEKEKVKEEVVKESIPLNTTNQGPLLAVCEMCNRPIYNGDEIVRFESGGRTRAVHTICCGCNEIKQAKKLAEQTHIQKVYRIWGYVLGGICIAIFIALGVYFGTKNSYSLQMGPFLGLTACGIAGFCLICCLFLKNNFVGDMVEDIFDWGFVKMPGVIYELSIDGLFWLLTVKLGLWILQFTLSIICGILAIVIGCVVSIFVFPFAIVRSYKHPEKFDD